MTIADQNIIAAVIATEQQNRRIEADGHAATMAHLRRQALALTIRPTHVMHPTIDALCDEMHLAGREELVHYAGASYRDPMAWNMCLAWLANRSRQGARGHHAPSHHNELPRPDRQQGLARHRSLRGKAYLGAVGP